MKQRLLASSRRLLHQAKTDALLRNSLFLMASTLIMALFGLVFWFLSAHLYSPAAVGLASTLITVTTVLSMSSLFGFDNSLVRFLPHESDRHKLLNTSLTLTGLGAIIIAGIYLIISNLWLPELAQALPSWITVGLFIATLICVTLNTLTDSIFLSWQKAEHILVADGLLSIAKLALPVVCVGLGAIGVYSGYAVGVAVAAAYSLVILGLKFGYRYRPMVDWAVVRRIFRYASGTYIANVSNALPNLIVPVMVATALSTGEAAYFNLAMTIASLLFTIPRATASSLFAEGSKHTTAQSHHIRQTYRHTAAILLPGIAGVIIFQPFVLGLFGHAYQAAGPTLVVLALSSILVAINFIYISQLLINQQTGRLIRAETLRTIVIVATCLPLMQHYGTMGAALGWSIGQAAMAAYLLTANAFGRRTRASTHKIADATS